MIKAHEKHGYSATGRWSKNDRDRGSLATPPLPHHRTYGSVYGGSVDYVVLSTATEVRPSGPKNAIGMAILRAGLFAGRQGPCGLPAVCAARSRPTPQRRSSANRVLPRFHCFQAIARNRRLSHSSSARNTDGVWQKATMRPKRSSEHSASWRTRSSATSSQQPSWSGLSMLEAVAVGAAAMGAAVAELGWA